MLFHNRLGRVAMLLATIFLVCAAQPAIAGLPRIMYVNASLESGLNDGSSWDNAYQGRLGLRSALADLAPGEAAQVWIAAGTYAPDERQGDPAAHFALRNDLAIFGGFAGGESSLDERDPQTHLTILTGDLNSDDTQNEDGFWLNDWADNSNNVVIAENVDGSAVLDGVTVRRGHSRISELNRRQGGNMRIVNGSPTIRSCVFQHGQAGGGGGAGGGGMGICSGAPVVEDCVFHGNDSSSFGGGVYHTGSSSAIFRRCLFEGNRGGSGAAFFNGCMFWDCNFESCGDQLNTPIIQDCIFRDNIGFFGAPAGMGIFDLSGQPVVERCIFHYNTSHGSGGGMHLRNSSAIVRNCDFVGNEGASDGGGALYADGAPLNPEPATFDNCRFVGNNGVLVAHSGARLAMINCTLVHNNHEAQYPKPFLRWPTLLLAGADTELALRNCIMWGNEVEPFQNAEGVQVAAGGTILLSLDAIVTVDHGCIEHWDNSLPGANVFEAPPLFTDIDGADDVPGTEDDDVRLLARSPCVDAGHDAFLPVGVRVDLDGQPRVQDGDGDTIAAVDLGAFEVQPVACLADIVSSGSFMPPGDGQVDGADLAFLLGAWGRAAQPLADIVSSKTFQPPPDGMVDGADLAFLLGEWGACE